MARAPAAAPEAVVEESAPAANVAADIALEEEAAGGGEAVVVATILRNADGSFTLQTGDEGPEMMDSAAMGATPEAEAATGQSFGADQIGELMTAVHELIDPDTEGGAQSKANFDEGFGTPPPAPAPVA
jgi:hypothetical protein